MNYLEWLFALEYGKLELPEPDLVIYLDLPTYISEQMMRQREAATGTTADIHEQDAAYLRRCRDNARKVANICRWKIIDCSENGQIRTVEDILDEAWGLVRELLER